MKIVQKYLRVVAIVLLFAFPVHAGEIVTFYHTDAVGTVLAISDAQGEKVWEVDYKPFGEEYAFGAFPGQVENSKRFVGKEYDDETRLNYFGARYMFTQEGRFLAPDPVRAVNGVSGEINVALLTNPQRLNVYAYSLNNPYRYCDPLGLAEVLVDYIVRGGSDASGKTMLGSSLVTGTAISLSKNKDGHHDALNFSGVLGGVSFPIPVGVTRVVAIFDDNHLNESLSRVEGLSQINSTSFVIGDFSKTTPSYVRFGEMTQKEVLSVSGFDISAGSHLAGNIKMKEKFELTHERFQSILGNR